MQWVWRWAVSVAALWIAAWLLEGIRFDSVTAAIVAALVLGVVNAVIGPILHLLALPATVLTFGLFALVINALLLLAASSMVTGFHVDGFWTAFWGAIVLGLVSGVMNGLLKHHR